MLPLEQRSQIREAAENSPHYPAPHPGIPRILGWNSLDFRLGIGPVHVTTAPSGFSWKTVPGLWGKVGKGAGKGKAGASSQAGGGRQILG